MTREKETVFTQSLMERLSESIEPPHTQASSLRLLKEAIRRDLEDLLNTRKPMNSELAGRDARATVLGYGLEEFDNLLADSDAKLQAIQEAIQRCLAEFEPRLREVAVTVQGGHLEKREIQLHIEAKLPLYPAIEVVFFDTVLDLTSEKYSVG